MLDYFNPTGYKASATLQVSVANAEILPTPPGDWTTQYYFRKLSLYNYSDCTLVINGETEFFVKAGLGFTINANDGDKAIYSLKIKENSINYTWIAEY